jgi:RNA polymerase sigma-70 factor (ECF subfamily)
MRCLITESISDAGLLERFARHQDEAAFGELVKRHGPQVLKVCRRGLPSEHDVEDVFQATFFVLAHKAAAVSWTESVESWLCAVARRLVLHARASAWQRQRRERPITTLYGARPEEYGGSLPERYHPLYNPFEEMEGRDLRRLLHAALGQLPEKYRAPVVLCYLEGMTNEEAARQLGWPAGTMSRRLQRARSLLRRRLARCGLMIALVVCAAYACAQPGQFAPPRQPATVSVHQAMQSLNFPAGAAMNLESRLQQSLGDREVIQEPEQLEALARRVQWVAEQTADQGPVRGWELWLFHAARMRMTALDLGKAARLGDRVALLSAARQMDTTCIGCHEAFGPQFVTGGSSRQVSARLGQACLALEEFPKL